MLISGACLFKIIKYRSQTAISNGMVYECSINKSNKRAIAILGDHNLIINKFILWTTSCEIVGCANMNKKYLAPAIDIFY